ncbi:hypothetical protein [Arthrobacter psychrochitiniphilus]|uniref:Uncharacterized protein n=1 Tax=Arthrobacter psychrochitiniphilus TaxID=291045 RepID=A0A2V3DS55_9MICC|nr:hypothetical protein [Arthrobacter psychrochitiniphilus]NYG18996.1 hypothetical protein [Arthrobacter psychrochitiniphilus]PXA66017.1 hypothetical protein CVS29_08475 [Arthrobacter psychrochitiniphilus]
MSEQPPWPDYPAHVPDPNTGQQYPQYAPRQQHAQPYYGTPHFIQPAPKKKPALPWILAGGGVLALAGVIGAVVLVSTLLGGGVKANMVAAPVTGASFQYPEGWLRTDENKTVINSDGSQPEERFSAINKVKDATALMVYEGGARPEAAVTPEKIHTAIDQGLAGQLAASPDELLYYRSTAGFGCLDDFGYTNEPAIVERDGMYGYSYGYTCHSYQGNVTGEYFVAYDSTGVSHRMTVEAKSSEWASSKRLLQSITASLHPAA